MILVTGGCGYVGSVLVPELLALGKAVRVVDTLWFGHQPIAHPRLETIQADIRACDPAWLSDVDAVIHLAGLSNDPTADFAPAYNAESNVQATKCLAELVAKVATEEKREIRFILASSCSVYYSASQKILTDIHQKHEETPVAPTANYSKTKRLAELELLSLSQHFSNFCPVILRKGTLFGMAPRMRFDLVVNTFTLSAWHKRQLIVHGSGEAWRPLLHIRDAVDAYIFCSVAPTESVRNQVFNLVRKNYRMLELAHWVKEVLEQEEGITIDVKRDRSVGNGERSYYVVGDKIERTLGFRPERGTKQSILEIWNALKEKKFGDLPQEDPQFFNIKWFKQPHVHDQLFNTNTLKALSA